MIKQDASKLLKKADRFISITQKFKREMNVFYDDKKRIQREIDIFETNPPKTMTSAAIKSVLAQLRDLVIQRNTLNSKEKSFFSNLQKLKKSKKVFLKLQSKKKSAGSLLQDAKYNLVEVLQELESELDYINTEREVIKSKFRRLASVEQPFGLEQLSLDNLPPIEIRQSLENIVKFREDNYERLKEKKPNLLKHLDKVILYLQDGDLSKPFSLDDTLAKIGEQHKNDYEEPEEGGKRKKKGKKGAKKGKKKGGGASGKNKAYLESSDSESSESYSEEFSGGFNEFVKESEAYQAYMFQNDFLLMNSMKGLQGKLLSNAKRLADYENQVLAGRNARPRDRLKEKLLELEDRKRENEELRREVLYERARAQRNKKMQRIVNGMKDTVDRQAEMMRNVLNHRLKLVKMAQKPVIIPGKINTKNWIFVESVMVLSPIQPLMCF